jgi:hypothetical protein
MYREIDIDKWFRLYLKKEKPDEKEMTPVQLTETKKAFMGGISYTLIYLYEYFACMNVQEDDAEKLEDFFNQVAEFWKSQKQKNF